MSKHSHLTMPQKKFVGSVTDWHNDWLAGNSGWQWLIECKIICSHYFWNWIQIGSIGGFPWRPELAVAGVCGFIGLLWSIPVSCAGLKKLLVVREKEAIRHKRGNILQMISLLRKTNNHRSFQGSGLANRSVIHPGICYSDFFTNLEGLLWKKKSVSGFFFSVKKIRVVDKCSELFFKMWYIPITTNI